MMWNAISDTKVGELNVDVEVLEKVRKWMQTKNRE